MSVPNFWNGIDWLDSEQVRKHRPIFRCGLKIRVGLRDGRLAVGKFDGWDGNETIYIRDRVVMSNGKPRRLSFALANIQAIIVHSKEGMPIYHEDVINYLNSDLPKCGLLTYMIRHKKEEGSGSCQNIHLESS